MERINPNEDTQVIIGEHYHRYRWLNQIVNGKVCDIACGAGYGSSIISRNPLVTSYTGIDISQEAIDYAKHHFKEPHVDFFVGNCYDIQLATGSVDTVISLETLEHLENPEHAIAEYKRILKEEGIFIGSVPSLTYEEVCTELYGKNPYHVQKFSLSAIKELVLKEFKFAHFFFSSLNVVSLISAEESHSSEVQMANLKGYQERQLGSLLFVTSNRNIQEQMSKLKRDVLDIETIVPLVEYDRIYVTPRNQTIEDQTRLINERDELIKNQDILINDLTQTIKDQTKLVDEKDELIGKQDILVNELKQTIEAQAKMVDERDTIVQSQDQTVRELKQTVDDQEKLVNDRDLYINRLLNMIEEQTKLLDDNQKMVVDQARSLQEIQDRIKITESFRMSLKNAAKIMIKKLVSK